MIKITIYGPTSKITCDGVLSKQVWWPGLRERLSYAVQGAEWSDAYRQGVWDGRKHLLRQTGAFPTGLVPTALKFLSGYGEVEVDDQREHPTPSKAGFDLQGISFDPPFDYQLEAAKTMVEKKQGIVRIATNGGKTEIACAVTNYLGLQTLFVVTTKELLYQAQDRFVKRLGVGTSEVGIIGDGKWKPGSWVTIATLDTLESRLKNEECQELLKATQVLFFDECHHLGSETWYRVSLLCPAIYRYGLSGTPLDRSDGANLRLVAATGDILVDIPNKFLVEQGVSARAKIIFDKITEPILGKVAYQTAYKQGVVENDQLTKKVCEWVKIFYEQQMGCLVLVEEIKHGNIIDNALWTEVDGVFIPHQFIYGNESKDVRKDALASFAEGSLPVLIASTILDEGVDVPTIDALIVAGSRKSRIKTMQRLGRGLRGKKLLVVEFANYCNKYLLTHSLQRYRDYKEEDCFPLYQSGPDVELVRKLWTED